MAQKNTLFNYFTKSPAPTSGIPDKKPKLQSTPPSIKRQPLKAKNEKTPKIRKSSEKKGSSKKLNCVKMQDEPGCKKKLIEDGDPESEEDALANLEDSGDEFVPEDDEVSEHEEISGDEGEEEESTSLLAKNNKRKRSFKEKPNKRKAVATSSRSLEAKTSQDLSSNDNYSWSFLKYDFLQPEKIKDAKGRRPNDPNYDPRTLYIPNEFLKNLTPGMRQWWELKRKHFDCVLFFKVGKFYEFYHMDAVIGVKELSLTFMRGEYAHCGFPEIAYGRFSANLVDKGYKVARVEQTETPAMMTARVKKMTGPSKFDKVVNREICQLTTKGTRIFSVADGEAKEAQCSYLLAIAEKELDAVKSCYGVCLVDTSVGTFYLSQFDDDRHSSRLRTLLAIYPPVQVLYERNRLTKRTNQILNTVVASTLKEGLSPETEFWTSSHTLKNLMENNYFSNNEVPEPLKSFVGDGDSLGLTASAESEMAIRCLGAITWFLTRGLLDFQLLSMARFEIYVPIDVLVNKHEQVKPISTRNMILDAITLKNLNIIESNTGGLEGTLLQRIDNCYTPFGKRLLRQWLCSPLTTPKSILARQKAVQVLKENSSTLSEAAKVLNKVPDLERLFSRIYAQSSKGLPESHPENRAVMFEEKIYSRRKIVEFIAVLNGFQHLQDTVKIMQSCEEFSKSDILINCTHFPSDEQPGQFPDLSEHLQFFKDAFDQEDAEKEGRIIPTRGVDPEYDAAMEELETIDSELKQYLKKQCQHFNCKVVYVGKDKTRFQLEVPESATRKANSEYELIGQRKGYKKYTTSTTKELLERQIDAEKAKVSSLQNLTKRMFAKFTDRYNDWGAAIECMATLDTLMSLATYCLSIEGDICVPFIKEINEKPFVNIVNGKYPCTTCEDNFIPNDTQIGGENANIMLLTGPNMGGKSTLMRQLGLLVVLAQMGSLVPAESMELTCVDRIFTRIGANDDIIAGDSTFYLELCETSAILGYATAHSLVLVDELGRGTSTYDGTAIAASVLNELCRMGCRTIFSTHYHTLVGSFKENASIKLAHMSCMAEPEEENEEGREETVTFLYKLADGACPKSYGFNAARLAGVPSNITKLGSCRAKALEEEANNRKIFRSIFTTASPNRIINVL